MSKSDGMIGLARKGETELECPFCNKEKVKVFHKEGYLQAKTSRISAGAKTTYHRVPDTYEVLEDAEPRKKTSRIIMRGNIGRRYPTKTG
ncbi:MAG: hypothetical protein ACTSRS_21745 [Candidatus Helarchaeota archaeon]